MAKSYQHLDQLDSALYFINKALVINENIGDLNLIVKNKIIKGNIKYNIDVDEATMIGEEVLEVVDKTLGYSKKADVHKLLHKCYKEQGNLSLALSMLEKYNLYSDSLTIENDNLALTRAAIQSDYEAKLYEQSIENESAQSALKLRQSKTTFAILLSSSIIILLIAYFFRSNMMAQKREKDELLLEIEELKEMTNTSKNLPPQIFQLNRQKIETCVDRKMNETDWKVLSILLENPVISNKEIAEKAYLSIDGIGSCLRRMYVAFDIKESKYKKISLLMKAVKLSTSA